MSPERCLHRFATRRLRNLPGRAYPFRRDIRQFRSMKPGCSVRVSILLRLSLAGLFGAWLATAQPVDPGFAGRTTFFPPEVPVYGEAIAEQPEAGPLVVIAAPVDLADFVNEYFYPALGTRLFDMVLGRKLELQVDAYRSARSALLNELADQLALVQSADEATRMLRLRAFAAEQSPRIQALENEAEQLRRALIDGRLLDRSADWSRSRKWILGQTRFPREVFEREAEFQVVRAAAFFQDGLLPEQRGLLLELAVDLRQRARASRPVPPPKTDDASAMFFSPALSRLRLPSKPPPELVARIGRFNRDKAALKDELREAVFAHDKSLPEDRLKAFTELAERQWPRFGPLEVLAEEIRIGLAAIPAPRLAAPPHVPPVLLRRIKHYMTERQAFINDFNRAIRAAQAKVAPPPSDRKLNADERVQRARQLAEERAAVREKAAKDFHEETQDRFKLMRLEYDHIQVSLSLVAAAQFDSETGQPLTPDTLLRAYSLAMEKFDTLGREEVIYRGYRTAMLMPGLSPEQRRLLFGAARVGLAQPLPLGELFPTTSMPVPRS